MLCILVFFGAYEVTQVEQNGEQFTILDGKTKELLNLPFHPQVPLYQGESIPYWASTWLPGRQEFKSPWEGEYPQETGEEGAPWRKVGSGNKDTFLQNIQRLRGRHEEKVV